MASHPPPQTDSPSLVGRLGTLAGVATLAAAVAAVPAALRVASVADPPVDTARAWLALTGIGVLPLLLVIGVLRAAREGLRAFAGLGALERALAAVAWSAWMLLGVALFGSVLRAKTHHHALAGVTFALGGLALGVLLALLSVRFAGLLRALSARSTARAVTAALLASLAPLALLAARVAHAVPELTPGARAWVVDGLALGLCALFAARRSFEQRRVLTLLGPPFAAAAVGLAWHLLSRWSGATEVFAARAPLFAALRSLLPFG